MKKVLSLLLALTLALSFAVCAFAAQPAGEPRFYSYPGKLPAQSEAASGLIYELPVVTGITAEWNGEIMIDNYFQPHFSHQNVAVTASFAEGEPETLTKWWDQGNGWWWEVFFEHDISTGTVTFYYIDINLYTAYLDTLTNIEEEYDWPSLAATLPQAAISVAADLAQQYINNQRPLDALRVDESVPVALAQDGSRIIAFTPEQDGGYFFYAEDIAGDAWPFVAIATQACVPIGTAAFYFGEGALMIELEAGKTYYILASEMFGDACEFKLGVSQMRALGPVMEFICRYLLFGWAWMPFFAFTGASGSYLLPGSYILSYFGSFLDIFNLLLPW